MLYVRDNEQTQRLVVVHVADDTAAVRAMVANWPQQAAGTSSDEARAMGRPGACADDNVEAFNEVSCSRAHCC